VASKIRDYEHTVADPTSSVIEIPCEWVPAVGDLIAKMGRMDRGITPRGARTGGVADRGRDPFPRKRSGIVPVRQAAVEAAGLPLRERG